MRCFKHSNNKKEGSKLKRDNIEIRKNTQLFLFNNMDNQYWELFHVKMDLDNNSVTERH